MTTHVLGVSILIGIGLLFVAGIIAVILIEAANE